MRQPHHNPDALQPIILQGSAHFGPTVIQKGHSGICQAMRVSSCGHHIQELDAAGRLVLLLLPLRIRLIPLGKKRQRCLPRSLLINIQPTLWPRCRAQYSNRKLPFHVNQAATCSNRQRRTRLYEPAYCLRHSHVHTRTLPTMVGFQKLLKFSLVPTVLFAILSFLSIVLTTHYWILTDYFVGRWLKRRSTFPEKTKFTWDDVIVDYTEPSTNATIVSGCLCFAAAINCVVAYFKLKHNAMDLDYHSVRSSFLSAAMI